MPKIKIPPKLLSWFRDQNLGVDKMAEFLELLNKCVPVFVVNPAEVPVATSDPNVGSFTVFQHQTDAVLNQDSPVSGTKYTLLDTTLNARIITIAVRCTWTVQPTPLEIHITIDGISLTAEQVNPVSNTWYIADFVYPEVAGPSMSASGSYRQAFLIEGRSVKVEAEITGGTVSNLSARLKYAKIP